MRQLTISLSFLCLTACTDRGTTEVTLSQLVAQQGNYAGRRVVVEGTLRSHPAPLHYWIEDDAYHRVELDHADDLGGREGAQVIVQGVFLYQKDRGRRIDVTSLE
ncbi:MAG: hypothetical protein ABR578_09165 [Chromatocurvus sp.]